MNTQLVDTLAQIIQSLTQEEKTLLSSKIQLEKQQTESSERPFYETATPEEWVKEFREWSENHHHNASPLSDEAISRESIYGERG